MFLKPPLQRWPVLYQERIPHALHLHTSAMGNEAFPIWWVVKTDVSLQRNATIHTLMGNYCLSGAVMLFLEGQTEAGLFHMSKGTVFMK